MPNLNETNISGNILRTIHEMIILSGFQNEMRETLDHMTTLISSLHDFEYIVIQSSSEGSEPGVIFAKSYHDEKFFDTHVIFTIDRAIQALRSKLPQAISFPEICDDETEQMWIQYDLPAIYQEVAYGVVSMVASKENFVDINDPLMKIIASVIARLLHENRNQVLKEDDHRNRLIQQNFVANLTHDLRNPLGSIKGYTTTLLRKNLNLSESQKQKFLTIIDQETDRLNEMIENTLLTAKFQSGQVEMSFSPVVPSELIREVIDSYKNQWPETNFEYSQPENEKVITADKQWLQIVIKNIISNAIKYAPKSSIIFNVENAINGIYIIIKDNGPGIPMNYRDNIFEQFFRVPGQTPKVHGTGLGLYICGQVIQHHHGNITVDSEVGQGTMIKMFLPERHN